MKVNWITKLQNSFSQILYELKNYKTNQRSISSKKSKWYTENSETIDIFPIVMLYYRL